HKSDKCQDSINEINTHLNEVSDHELQKIHSIVCNDKNINKLNSSNTYNAIINTIKELPKFNLKSVFSLLCTIRYLYGKNKDQIISSYLQNKASQYLLNSLYKPKQSFDQLSSQNKQLKYDLNKLEQSKKNIVQKV
ncbi:19152_t:CDS:1, partial [Cetraspora pellucida]